MDYYDRLNAVRMHNDLLGWIKFFLKATIYTAKDAKIKFKNVMEYTRTLEDSILALSFKTDSAIKVIRAFYGDPIMNGKQIAKSTGLGKTTVDNIIKHLLDHKILFELTGYSRNRIFALQKYIDIF